METHPPTRPTGPIPSWAQFRIWHLVVLVLFSAIAIADIKAHPIREPALAALAAGGLVLYGLMGWIGWWAVRRFELRLGPVLLLMLYSIAMTALFLVVIIICLVIAYVYRGGWL